LSQTVLPAAPTTPAPRARWGLYGGAFDPPHLAHTTLARTAIAQLQLDQLRILPTGQAWHKARPLSLAAHRVAMAQLAFADVPAAQVDARETQRSGPSYTIDTLNELSAQYPATDWYLLIGADQFAAFAQWHRWQDIAQIATICIAARATDTWTNSENSMQNGVQRACKMHSIAMPSMPHSATDIRSRVRQGLGIDHLVNPGVARYIVDHQLYSS
jgi:nicotinate-nucleotide adenylyltransferase